MKKTAYLSILVLLVTNITSYAARNANQQPATFINAVFNHHPPKAKAIWLNKTLKQQIADILQHPYHGFRIHYWQQQGKTLWILDEIGKEKPITIGIIIQRHKITRLRVLAFRESRGWEVRQRFFTSQFNQVALKKDHQLDTPIDNISGATLSVRAITKLARVALLLDQSI